MKPNSIPFAVIYPPFAVIYPPGSPERVLYYDTEEKAKEIARNFPMARVVRVLYIVWPGPTTLEAVTP